MAEALARTVLVTRPEPGLSDTRAALETMGWKPHLAPMLKISTVPMHPARHIGRVVVTSSQSLEGLHDAIPLSTPLTAVGERTAERARAAGFTCVDHAAGNAASLVRYLGRPESNASLLLATGEGLGVELAADLRTHGWRVTRRVVYRTATAPALDASTRDLLSGDRVAAILFYSAVTARSFLDALGPERTMLSRIRALALSSRIGDALRNAPFADIGVATRPSQSALLSLLGPAPLDPLPLAPATRPASKWRKTAP